MLHEEQLDDIRLIASDDVFENLLADRKEEAKENRRRKELFNEYYGNPASRRDQIDRNRMTVSKYIRTRLKEYTIVQSNGETALDYWQSSIGENALCLIDEPENSLSPANVLKLKQFIEESVRFFNCQFVIATHSPFLLALANAKIYDLDAFPVDVKKWTELDSVRAYHDFFAMKSDEFK